MSFGPFGGCIGTQLRPSDSIVGFGTFTGSRQTASAAAERVPFILWGDSGAGIAVSDIVPALDEPGHKALSCRFFHFFSDASGCAQVFFLFSRLFFSAESSGGTFDGAGYGAGTAFSTGGSVVSFPGQTAVLAGSYSAPFV